MTIEAIKQKISDGFEATVAFCQTEKGMKIANATATGIFGVGAVFSTAKAVSALVTGSALGFTFWAVMLLVCYDACRTGIGFHKHLNSQFSQAIDGVLQKSFLATLKDCAKDTLAFRHILEIVA